VRLQKYSTKLIGKCFKFGEIRSVFEQVQRLKKTAGSVSTHIKFKSIIHRGRNAKSIVNEIFDSAWDIIYEKFKKEAAVEVQRIWRGYQDVVSNYKKSSLLRSKITQKIEGMMATRIQKYVRGYLVRIRMDRLHRAAWFIQGFLRMRMFWKFRTRARQCAKVLQKWMMRYTYRKKIIQERLDSFMGGAQNRMRHNQKIEYDVVFKKKVDFLTSENVMAYTNVEFFATASDFQAKIPVIESYIPEASLLE
jgi:hypothetical protein